MESNDTMRATPINSVNFNRYGKVADVPDGPSLASDNTFAFWSDVVSFEIPDKTEIGYCTVYRQDDPTVDWMERHILTPEIIIPIDTSFILPVMSDDGNVEAFRVRRGQAVVIAPGVWHSACKPVDTDDATYFVLFRRGTPGDDVIKKDIQPVKIATP